MRLNERLSVIADLDVDGADLRAAALGELDECAVCVDTECTRGREQVRREQRFGRDGFLVARCGDAVPDRRDTLIERGGLGGELVGDGDVLVLAATSVRRRVGNECVRPVRYRRDPLE